MCREIIEERAGSFERLFELLVRENAKYNLTAITVREEVYSKHFADSLTALPLLFENASVIDIGTGAGFPALPLLIAQPTLRLTALDSVAKKLSFVRLALNELGLSAQTVHARAEDYAKTARETFDFALSRAVAALPTLCEYALPFVKVGGKFIAYKTNTEEAAQAKPAISALGGGRVEIVPIDGEQARCLIVVEKIKPTPLKYPRGGNKPRLNPL